FKATSSSQVRTTRFSRFITFLIAGSISGGGSTTGGGGGSGTGAGVGATASCATRCTSAASIGLYGRAFFGARGAMVRYLSCPAAAAGSAVGGTVSYLGNRASISVASSRYCSVILWCGSVWKTVFPSFWASGMTVDRPISVLNFRQSPVG